MADLKISQLSSATTPLAGTEVLPIVQSGATVKVAVSNLTAGRTQTSNGIVQGTATTGYNFTANTPAAGMTSQLLNWYEEGTYTPVISGTSGTASVGSSTGYYTRIGRMVYVTISCTGMGTGTMSGGQLKVSLPITASNTTSLNATGTIRYNGVLPPLTTVLVAPNVVPNQAYLICQFFSNAGYLGDMTPTSVGASFDFYNITIAYNV